jgi:opacity protein-like surface antigen
MVQITVESSAQNEFYPIQKEVKVMDKLKIAILLVGLFTFISQVNLFAEDSGTASLKGIFSDVSGDEQKYRENLQISDDFYGGLEGFSLRKGNDTIKLDIDGRALYEKDLGLNLNLIKENTGSIKINLDSYRKYYDSSNVYYPYFPYIYELDRDLHTDRGSYSIEADLTLPKLPKILLGYEKKTKEGEENLYWGGWVRDGAKNLWIVWANPLYREVDYDSDNFFIGVEHKLGNINLRFRQEWGIFEGDQSHREPGYRTDGPHVFNRDYRNILDHKTSNTRFSLGGNILKNLNLDIGYDYQTVKNKNNYDVDCYTPAGAIYYGEHSINYNNNIHEGESKLNSFKTNLTLLATDTITIFGGIKYRQGKSDNNARREEEGSGGTAGDGNTSTAEEIWTFITANKEKTWAENFGVTLSAVPKTKLTLGLDLEQGEIEYDWNATIWTASLPGESKPGEGDWSWVGTNKFKRTIPSISIRSRPLSGLTAYAKYRYKTSKSNLNDEKDYVTRKPGDPEYSAPAGFEYLYYPGYIEERKMTTPEFIISFDIKPWQALTIRPRYEQLRTDYEVVNERDPIGKIAEYNRKVYGLGLNIEPNENILVSLNYSYRDAETETLAQNTSASIGRHPYTGATDKTYLGGLIERFDSTASTFDGQILYTYKKWVFNTSGGIVDGKGNFDTTLWWGGLSVERNLGKGISLKGGLSHYDYDEDGNGDINDYRANAFLIALNARF